MKYLTLIILLIYTFIGCKTDPPLLVIAKKGKIEISANIEGAKIFVNGSDSGELTPATLELDPGKYTFKLIKEGYNEIEKEYVIITDHTIKAEFNLSESNISKIVLVEDFANVSCDPCVISNQILHEISQEYENKLAIIKFPVNFPSPNDPFYLHAKEYADKRRDYYKIFSAPTVIVDGTQRPISTSLVSIKDDIDQSLNENTPFQISVTKTMSNNKLDISTDISLTSSFEGIENLVVQTVVIEQKIEFQSPPGSNGEKIFYDVMRKMLPDAEGTNINLSENTQKIDNSVAFDPAWQEDQIKVIVFIQNKLTKKIYQAAISN